MAGLSQQQQMQLLAELEIEMMADMYNRMTTACQKKCIAPSYGEGDLSKGESVCLDRCVAKYLEVHDNLGKKLTEKSMQDQQLQLMQQQQQAAEKKS
ncbi:mitochondrial import inner membrane translocase subunit Tim10-like [Acanthaster planci]|uniref:Mitochondrial import inner membrane translocase subunit n=1 Tax=Acanthaster planci TaxID=133434 RepID=A0A8B7Y0N3_ACAPL|nr:mitochondrial import inner membrane translocase subunit Tim10-like [Acanthaster planci]